MQVPRAGWAIGAVVAVILGKLLWPLLPKNPPKVFVSYDHSEDAHYKRLLAAWNKNRRFNFEMEEHSPTEPIDSKKSAVVKKALEKRLKDSEHLLVIVGPETHQSSWVNWEINRAKQKDVRLKLAAVKVDRGYKSPSELLDCGAAFANGFTEENVLDVLKRASNKY